MRESNKRKSRASGRGVSREPSNEESDRKQKPVAQRKGESPSAGPALTVPGKFPSSGSRTRHALIDDIGNPAVPEQEDYGGAGDLGTTGAVGGRLSRSAKVGIHDSSGRRVGPGNTGERIKRRRKG
jgi:hypothetical protein